MLKRDCNAIGKNNAQWQCMRESKALTGFWSLSSDGVVGQNLVTVPHCHGDGVVGKWIQIWAKSFNL